MKKSRLLGAVCAAIFTFITLAANAATISHGALTTKNDGSTNLITDSLNNYEWLRFDVIAPLTYIETLSVLDTQDGGGWIIAGTEQALLFLDAFFAPSGHNCSIADTGHTRCGILPTPTWRDGDFGPDLTSLPYYEEDMVWYTDDGVRVGYIDIGKDAEGIPLVYANHNWSTIASSDQYSHIGVNSSFPVSWLLYRPANPVPVPPAVWLFSFGLLGLIGIARRKKTA